MATATVGISAFGSPLGRYRTEANWPRNGPSGRKRPQELVFRGIFQSSKIPNLQDFPNWALPVGGITIRRSGVESHLRHVGHPGARPARLEPMKRHGGAYDFMPPVPAIEHDKQSAQLIEPVCGNAKHNRGFPAPPARSGAVR